MANNTAQGKTLEKKGFKLPISGNALVLLIALVLVTAIFSALNPNYLHTETSLTFWFPPR